MHPGLCERASLCSSAQLPAAKESGQGGARSEITQRRPAHQLLSGAIAGVCINYEPATINAAVVRVRLWRVICFLHGTCKCPGHNCLGGSRMCCGLVVSSHYRS